MIIKQKWLSNVGPPGQPSTLLCSSPASLAGSYLAVHARELHFLHTVRAALLESSKGLHHSSTIRKHSCLLCSSGICIAVQACADVDVACNTPQTSSLLQSDKDRSHVLQSARH